MRRGLLCLGLALLAACASRGVLEDQSAIVARLTFDGAKKASRQELLTALETDIENMARFGLDKAAADDSSFGLREYYYSRGFPFARVDYTFTPLEGGKVNFIIAEGPRIRIDEVVVEGIHDLDYEDLDQVGEPEDLVRFLKPVRRNLFGRRKSEYYVVATVEKAARDMNDFLRAAGYLNAWVSKPEATFDEEGGHVDLLVIVRPGQRHYLSEVEFNYQALEVLGSEATPTPVEGEVDPARIERGETAVRDHHGGLGTTLTGLLGSAFAPHSAWGLRARVIDYFRQRGYPDCRVAFEETRRRGRVSLSYSIDPGPEVTIGKVELDGFVDTKEPFARDRVGIEPGSPYNSKAVREAFRGLYRTGVFESVRIDLEDTDESERDLSVRVVEAPGREVYIEPGYGSYERLRVLIGGKERNLFGTGKVLSAETKLGQRAQGGKLALTDPWFLDKDLIATYALFLNRREEPSFTRREAGFTTGVTEEWTDEFSSTIGYQYRRTLLNDVTADDEAAQEALTDVDISSIALTLTWEGRDDVFLPTEGLRTRSIVEWGGEEIGSELDFTRLKFDLAHLTSLNQLSVVGVGIGVGVILPQGSTEVIPIQERFFNGGEDTVRSYREDKLGPVDGDGDPIGGEAFTVASIEFRQRVAGNLQTALFLDTGNVSPEAQDVFAGEDYGWGIGIGLRYLLPIGPVRLDGALNPDAGPDDDDFVVHFAVGMSF